MVEPKDPWWIDAKQRQVEGVKWWTRPALQQRRDALSNPETLDPKIRYYTRLAALQHLEDPFVDADAPENPLLLSINPAEKDKEEMKLHTLYAAKLTPYHFMGRSDKIDHIDPRNLNVGHKLHLNVGIDDVVAVSEYLKEEGFYHKFLSGGEVTDGTVFTIYVGSKNLADKLAQQLSHDLKPLLKRPVRKDEVEYAPNIPGRFVGDKIDFMQYGIGICGISITRDMAGLMTFDDQATRERHRTVAFETSFDKLASKYGAYFYGSN